MQMTDVLLRRYFEQGGLRREAVPFGLTNHSEFVYAEGRKYVARLYDPHSETKAKLDCEIELTSFLENAGLPFRVPGFVPARCGDLFIELPDGRLGALMTFIEGEVPDTADFSEAYFRYVALSEAEIERIPLLMEQHYTALICFDIGQHEAGKPVADPFAFIPDQWLRRKKWLVRESGRLTDLLFRSAKAGEQLK